MTIFAIEKCDISFEMNKLRIFFQTNDIFKRSLSKKLFVIRRLFKEMYSHIYNYRTNGQKTFAIIN